MDQSSLQKFVDEAMIRNVIARYADVATRADYESFHSLWTDEGEFIIGEAPKEHHATGPADTVALFRKLRANKTFFVQFALPGVIDIDGDEATTRTFIHESTQGPDETYYRCHCIAFDRLQRSGENWLFRSRSFQYLWLDTGAFSGNGFPLFPTGSGN
ncbi:nuclear transport factor 2 family protein [Methylobacterium sp. J-076]|uniref:nuclear transport factor 2 family protein n=1 Tax=Methylobacterium sp. J-076 TaxID=2836655 RepID=UPI001FBBDE3F|nr:nuclear transport factor 2 family protein [Methylobacterium sp. J-076]MCJ2011506.1 nuclear transport factor 2 family protein [Methylobacterium sp. J-076]